MRGEAALKEISCNSSTFVSNALCSLRGILLHSIVWDLGLSINAAEHDVITQARRIIHEKKKGSSRHQCMQGNDEQWSNGICLHF